MMRGIVMNGPTPIISITLSEIPSRSPIPRSSPCSDLAAIFMGKAERRLNTKGTEERRMIHFIRLNESMLHRQNRTTSVTSVSSVFNVVFQRSTGLRIGGLHQVRLREAGGKRRSRCRYKFLSHIGQPAGRLFAVVLPDHWTQAADGSDRPSYS